MFIIHTANLYLDRPFISLSHSGFGKIKREMQKKVLLEIVNITGERKADALLIAGNLLDEEYLTDETMEWLLQVFESIAPIPVIIAPGATDPISKYSPYLLELLPENVVVFNQSKWMRWDSNKIPLVIHGFAVTRGEESIPSISDFNHLETDRNHVILAHDIPFIGVTDTICDNSTDSFINSPVSYIALGKEHKYRKVCETERLTACYCGLPEPLCFEDVPPFGVLGVQFRHNNEVWSVSKVECIPTQQMFYSSINIDISNANLEVILQSIQSEINKFPKPRAVQIFLEGTISLTLLEQIPKVMEEVAKDCELFTWSNTAEIEEQVNLEENGYKTVLTEYYKTISEEITSAPDIRSQQMVRRAKQLTTFFMNGLKFPIPALETQEVPFI